MISRVRARLQPCIEPQFDRLGALLLEPHGLGASPLLRGELCVRRPPPHAERLVERGHGPCGVSADEHALGTFQLGFERGCVERRSVEVEQVAGRLGEEMPRDGSTHSSVVRRRETTVLSDRTPPSGGGSSSHTISVSRSSDTTFPACTSRAASSRRWRRLLRSSARPSSSSTSSDPSTAKCMPHAPLSSAVFK